MKATLSPMTVGWIKVVMLAALLALVGRSAAQVDELPPLASTASDPSGIITLFYPEGWSRTLDENALILQEADSDQAPIIVSAEVVTDGPSIFEAIPEWFNTQEDLPASSLFTPEEYGGFSAWLVQGESLYQRGDYSAVALIAIEPEKLAIVRSSFPAERLGESAALVTAILQEMIILPVSVELQNGELRVNLPFGWFQAEGLTEFYTAPNENDLRAITRQETPTGLGLTLRLITDGPTTLDEFLGQATAVIVDRINFSANENTVTLLLRRDNVKGGVELVWAWSRGNGVFLELRAVSASIDRLLESRALAQAIFSSVALQ